MDIAAGIASIDAALKIAKGIREVEKAYDQVTLKGQIIDLMGSLYEAKAQLLEARHEIDTRDREIADLNAKLKKQSETVEFDGYTYAANDAGKPTGAPFCGACIAKDGTQLRFNNLLDEHWQCPRCKALASGLRKFP